jgi:hypothetical protein
MKLSEIYLKAAELIDSRRGGMENRMCFVIDEVQGLGDTNIGSANHNEARGDFVTYFLGGQDCTDQCFPESEGVDVNSSEADDIRVLALLFAHAAAEYEELPTKKYNAVVACSVQVYSDIEVEAKYDWEAIEIAKDLAADGASNVAWDTADDHRVVEVVDEDNEETIEGSEDIYV